VQFLFVIPRVNSLGDYLRENRKAFESRLEAKRTNLSKRCTDPVRIDSPWDHDLEDKHLSRCLS